MDMKEIETKAKEILSKIKDDDNFKSEFKKDPVKAVEGVLGVDLPDEQLKAVAEAVKAKVDLDGIAGKVGGVLSGLFGKDGK